MLLKKDKLHRGSYRQSPRLLYFPSFNRLVQGLGIVSLTISCIMHFRKYMLIDSVNQAPLGSQGDFLNISHSSSCLSVWAAEASRRYGEPIMYSIKWKPATVQPNIKSFHLQSGAGRESRRENNATPERTSPHSHLALLVRCYRDWSGPLQFYRCAYARGHLPTCVCVFRLRVSSQRRERQRSPRPRGGGCVCPLAPGCRTSSNKT